MIERDNRSIMAKASGFMNALSESEKRVVVYGGGVIAIILLYFFLLEPIAISNRELAKKIPPLAMKVERYKSIVNASGDSKKQKSSVANEFDVMLSRCFKAETSDIAAGELSQLIKRKTASIGLALKSINVEKPKKHTEFEEIAVKISFNASLDEITRLLQNIEQDRKAIVVKEAKMHIVKTPNMNNEVEMLNTELTLSALRYITN